MGIRRKGRNKGIISGTAALIKKCGLSLIVFELLYKLAAFAIGYPLYLAGQIDRHAAAGNHHQRRDRCCGGSYPAGRDGAADERAGCSRQAGGADGHPITGGGNDAGRVSLRAAAAPKRDHQRGAHRRADVPYPAGGGAYRTEE